MNYFWMALICSAVGMVPLIPGKRWRTVSIFGSLSFLFLWLIFWLNAVSTVGPFFGPVLPCILALLAIAAFIEGVKSEEFPKLPASFPAFLALCFVVAFIARSGMLRSREYAAIIGPMEKRVWTSDIQPKDPHHIRQMNSENALYRAKNSLTQGGNNYGSRFEISEKNLTLQMIKGKLYYVIPLDFRNEYNIWSSSRSVPGYVMVSAEDDGSNPNLVILPEEKRFRYTPHAFLGFNLERHLRENGYLGIGLDDYTFEIDDEGNPWWVVSTYVPTIVNSGDKITGVVVVDPVSGKSTFYSEGNVPEWVDRVMPADNLKRYLGWWGEYSKGWWNSWWDKEGLTEPEDPILVYGSDGNPYWVTGITSKSNADTSLVGLVYTNSRTGKSVYYQTDGGSTDKAIIDAVKNNQDVKYKALHPVDPQIYNIHGRMASVMPLLNASHAVQGVAVVDVKDIQKVAVGADRYEAIEKYQELIGDRSRMAISNEKLLETLSGAVARIHGEVQGNSVIYRIYVNGVPHVFYGTKALSRKLAITEPGDQVVIGYYASGEEEEPMKSFDNLSVPLEKTKLKEK